MVVMGHDVRSVWCGCYQWGGEYKKLWWCVLTIVHFVQYCVIKLPTTNHSGGGNNSSGVVVQHKGWVMRRVKML